MVAGLSLTLDNVWGKPNYSAYKWSGDLLRLCHWRLGQTAWMIWAPTGYVCVRLPLLKQAWQLFSAHLSRKIFLLIIVKCQQLSCLCLMLKLHVMITEFIHMVKIYKINGARSYSYFDTWIYIVNINFFLSCCAHFKR